MISDCLLLPLSQGLDRVRVDSFVHRVFPLGEGEEQGYHRRAKVSGEWQESSGQTLRGGPAATSVWYRARFAHPGWHERTLLRFDGAFVAGNIWLNGKLLGSHYGFPGPFGFDIASHLGAENLLAVCVETAPDGGHLPPALTGLRDWWPLGLVGRVWLERVGGLIVDDLRVTFRLSADRAEMAVRTEVRNLDGRDMDAGAQWQLVAPGGDRPQASWRRTAKVAGHENLEFETTVPVDRPQLWWPWTLGEQNFYNLRLNLDAGEARSSQATRLVGVREIDLRPEPGGVAWTINGLRHFPRGAVLPPLPPGSDGDPIGAWRRAGLDLALSRGQLPSQQTAASADAAGVLLVIDPPPIGSGPDEEAQAAHQQEALRLIGSHASAAVLLQRGEGLLRNRDDVGARASEEPYVLATTERAQIEAARRAKFQPQMALVLEGLPSLEEGEGALATTAALGSWTHVDGGGLRLRFHVVNDERSVFGRAVLRWRLSAPAGGWAPLRRDRHGEVDVTLPASDEPPVVIEVDVSPPAGDVLVLEVELDRNGEAMSRLSYRLDE